MKNKTIILLGALLIITTMLLSSCSRKSSRTSEPEVIPVEVTLVKHYTIDRVLQLTGSLTPWKKTNLGAQMPGIIKKIYVEAGDRVKKGQLLVQMDDAQLTQARVQYTLAKMDYERMKPLMDEGSISPNQFEKIKGAYEAAKAGYELTLANTQIRAPFSGVVTTKWMDEGDVFQLMPGPAGSPAILTLMQINPIKITVYVPESYLPKITTGQSATVTVDVLPNREFHGEVSRIDPAIDPLTRTFAVEIRVENPAEELRPGMFARVSLQIGKETVLAVPRSALIHQLGSGKYYSFIVENGIAHRRDVTMGKRFDALVEVTHGLAAGDQIVIKGQYRLKEGSKVSIGASTTKTNRSSIGGE